MCDDASMQGTVRSQLFGTVSAYGNANRED
jgi:hypothetical protein